MKKNGFVFIESVIVLVVVALSLATLISSYSLVKRKTQEKEYYDKASDKYLLYSLSNLGTDDSCNYAIDCGSKLTGVSADTYRNSNTRVAFRADADDSYGYNCTKTKAGQIIYNCNQVFSDLHLVRLYVVENIVNELNGLNNQANANGKNYSTAGFYDSGTVEYMKSINKCNDIDYTIQATSCKNPITYLIGVFERGNNEFYYASIEIASEEDTREVVERSDGWYHYTAALIDTIDVDQQIWYYYENNKPITGLHKLAVSPNTPNTKYYYYFDSYTGIMKVGWVYYDEAYHLFSPVDFGNTPDGTLDGRRINSCSSTRIKVRVNSTKDFYFDRQGVCYTCQSGNCKCTDIDTIDPAKEIEMTVAEYMCNGDESY